MEIKLIASDMDDTLLNKDCQISPRNEAAIREALDAGVLMRICCAWMCRWLPITALSFKAS